MRVLSSLEISPSLLTFSSQANKEQMYRNSTAREMVAFFIAREMCIFINTKFYCISSQSTKVLDALMKLIRHQLHNMISQNNPTKIHVMSQHLIGK